MSTTPVPTPFSTLIAQRQQRGAEVIFDIPDDWLQGRTSFGGLVSALSVQAMHDVAGGGWPEGVTLRALQVNFIAPVGAGPLAVQVQVLREGRSIRQVQALARHGGESAALLVGVFGSDRPTSLAPLRPMRPPPRHAVDELPTIPFVPGTRPNFLLHFDTRWADGERPFSGGTSWHASIHMRLADDDAATLPPELVTVLMADVSPTPALGHFSQPVPASSVSWALELRPLPPGEAIAGWWRADNEALAADGGYVNQRSTLWAPGGRLAALAYQVVTVYG